MGKKKGGKPKTPEAQLARQQRKRADRAEQRSKHLAVLPFDYRAPRGFNLTLVVPGAGEGAGVPLPAQGHLGIANPVYTAETADADAPRWAAWRLVNAVAADVQAELLAILAEEATSLPFWTAAPAPARSEASKTAIPFPPTPESADDAVGRLYAAYEAQLLQKVARLIRKMDPVRATAMWDHRAATTPTPTPATAGAALGDRERAGAPGAGDAGAGAAGADTGDAGTIGRAGEDTPDPTPNPGDKAAAVPAAAPALAFTPAPATEPFQRNGAAVLLVSEGETGMRVHAEASGQSYVMAMALGRRAVVTVQPPGPGPKHAIGIRPGDMVGFVPGTQYTVEPDEDEEGLGKALYVLVSWGPAAPAL